MPESDDHRLLAEFVRDRSESAFTELVRRYAGLVHSTAFRFCGNPHHAEEITQSVFVILARKAGTLSPRVVVSGWLYQTARLTAANFVKGEMRRRRREQEAVMQSNLLETDPAAWGKIAPLLDDAMGALGETDRNAVLLRYFENRTSSEIGVALRMNEETARKRVNRALEKLRQFFVKRGVTVSGAALSGAISANSVQPISAFMVKSISAVALAKGATASTSTLTLIKGALKIMAWTKMKITAITVVGVLLVGGTATISIKVFRERGADHNDKPVRYWVDQALWGINGANAQETYGTLRRIGAPAAALLVQALTQTNSSPKDPTFPASAVRQNAFAALEQMGPSAKNQVPELIGLLKYDDKYVRIWATMVLAGIGPAAKDAVPALMEESQDANYAAYAKEALRRIRP